MQRHDSIMNSHSEYIAELMVELPSDSTEFARICEILRDELGTEVLTVVASRMGTRITCAVPDHISFLSSLPNVPNISSWRLLPN
jgi:hypothetical protein